ECPIYAALRDGEVHQVDDEVFWHSDGHCIAVEYTSTPIWEDGQVSGAVVVFREISERLRAEQEKQQAFDEIQRLKEQLEQERDYLRDEIRSNAGFSGIIGQSQAIQRTLAQIYAVAQTPASVLILGESGVGKEMVARAIHENSERAEQPLVKVNCASIPAELFESEFFGHIKGSFTGAHRDRVGRLQLANRGTLFLDEVGEIPLDLQGKLLRALQENEFERVGDEKTIRVDVRIIAATNRSLIEEVRAGRFREDLYYRLSVFPVEVPPLRERRDDISAIAQHFIQESSKQLGRHIKGLTSQQLQQLQQHHWPGNIRELKNVIERAVILSQDGKLRLDLALPSLLSEPAIDSAAHIEEDDSDYLTEEQFRELEKQNIIKALKAANGKISGQGGAAQRLNIKPSTLSYRIKNLGIHF
ncbi:MAG: sigma 54-interacting transcriptional regulator, partial [Pseudomonadota bacterium]|nr:sigma 54-interacting transcriptional regulator [Pseudomonadota bacterium]